MFQRSSLTTLWPTPAGQPARGARTLRQQTLHILLLVAGVVFILCIYLFQASRITTTEFHVMDLQYQYARQQRLNANLLAQLAAEQSFTRMSERAHKIGFAPVGDNVFYVAITPTRPQAPSQTLVQTTAALSPKTQATTTNRVSIKVRQP